MRAGEGMEVDPGDITADLTAAGLARAPEATGQAPALEAFQCVAMLTEMELVLGLMLLPCGLFASQLALNVGVGIPLSEIDLSNAGGGKDKIGETGATIGGQYLFDLTKQLGVGVDVNYTKFGDKDSTKLSSI